MNLSTIFKISSILWAVWGVFHLLLGVGLIYLFSIGSEALVINMVANDPLWSGLFKATDPVVTAHLMNYSWDIGWFGLVTTIGAYFVWKQVAGAVFLCAIVGGLADMGYFIFVDMQGFAPPIGQAMTFISAAAIILSFYAHFRSNKLKELQESNA